MKTTQKSTGLIRLVALTVAMQFFASFSSAQVGVIVLDEGVDVPFDQWYMVRNDTEENSVYIYNEDKYIRELLEGMLKPFDLKLKDAYTDDEGDPYFYLDNGNGYESYIWYLKEKDGMALLQVTTLEVEVK